MTSDEWAVNLTDSPFNDRTLTVMHVPSNTTKTFVFTDELFFRCASSQALIDALLKDLIKQMQKDIMSLVNMANQTIVIKKKPLLLEQP